MERKNLPMVSVITGYYNRPVNLIESVQSILNQTYSNFEYIIFDDCSTDATRKLLEDFDDPRLKLIKHNTNMGFTKGMVKAIAESKGDLIAVHGAGDISFPTRIQKQVELFLNDSDVGIVSCLIEDVSPEEIKILEPDKTGFTGGEVMYRRDFYFRAGGYNPLFYYGQFTPLRIEIMKLAKSAYVNELLYRRIHYKNGVTKNKSKRIKQSILLSIGRDTAEIGFLNVDFSGIVVEKTCRDIALLRQGSEDELVFTKHAKRRKYLAYIFYKLYRLNLFPKYGLIRLGWSMRKRRSRDKKEILKGNEGK